MKKTLLALLCATSMLGGISMSYAAEDGDMLPPPPPPAEDVLPPHDAPLPPKDAPRPHKFDKKDMKKFEKRMAEKLNLTEEQKAQAENNETEIVIQNALLQDVQNVLNKAEQDKKNFSSFPEKWRENSNLKWWIFAEIICGAFLFYLLRIKEGNGWHVTIFFISSLFLMACFISGFFISPIFTLRNILFWLIWGIDVFLLYILLKA